MAVLRADWAEDTAFCQSEAGTRRQPLVFLRLDLRLHLTKALQRDVVELSDGARRRSAGHFAALAGLPRRGNLRRQFGEQGARATQPWLSQTEIGFTRH